MGQLCEPAETAQTHMGGQLKLIECLRKHTRYPGSCLLASFLPSSRPLSPFLALLLACSMNSPQVALVPTKDLSSLGLCSHREYHSQRPTGQPCPVGPHSTAPPLIPMGIARRGVRRTGQHCGQTRSWVARRGPRIQGAVSIAARGELRLTGGTPTPHAFNSGANPKASRLHFPTDTIKQTSLHLS